MPFIFESTIYSYSLLDYILLIAITFFLIYFMHKDKAHKIIYIFFALILAITCFGIYDNHKEVEGVKSAFHNKSYNVVEGVIENFHAMHKSGHESEYFDVNNTHFRIIYSRNYPDEKTLYYTLTKNRNGPITRNGQRVKIYYIQEELPKLCIPFVEECIIFNVGSENKIIKMWVYD